MTIFYHLCWQSQYRILGLNRGEDLVTLWSLEVVPLGQKWSKLMGTMKELTQQGPWITYKDSAVIVQVCFVRTNGYLKRYEQYIPTAFICSYKAFLIIIN